ncbi:hypothetical protein [Arthrobacter sp. SX1312]|uniref:hypothetical protein n=1 Tax=Arthrobacter sp. SX1312 TaxID=2058896 RepID=UPI0015E1E84E|nr:hypothetical protein [Arthrobacter sp. SX1312]
MAGVVVSLLLAAGALVLTAPSGRLHRVRNAPVDRALRGGIQDGPLILDLLAAVLSAGASVESALLVVGEACDPAVGSVLTRVRAARLLGASWEAAWDAGAAEGRLSTDGPSTGFPAAGFPTAGFPTTGQSRPERLAPGRRPALLGPALPGPALRRRTLRGTDPLPVIEDIRRGLRFGTATGAPSAALLHAHAAQLRRRHNREVDRRAAALGVQLVLPLGLCSLPAFICLGVVPLVLGLLPDL